MNIIGQQVRKYRKNLGLTQEELAEGICNRSYISQMEKGSALPTPEILEKIAERLQVPIKDLSAELDVSNLSQVHIQNGIRHIISSIEENNWEKAHKWVCKLAGAELSTAEKSVYLWGKGLVAQSDHFFYQAVAYYLESISLARNEDDPLLLIRSLTSLGELYCHIRQSDRAVPHLNEALRLALSYDVSGMARVALHYSVGMMHLKIGEYHSGIEQFHQADKLNQAYDSLYKSGDIYMGLAICYRHLKKYDEAEQMNFKALEVLKLYSDTKRESRIAGVHNNLGIIYRCTQRYDMAIANLQKAINIHEGMGNQHWLNNSLIELANVYNLLERHEEAKHLCETVIENQTTEHVLAEVKLTLSETYYNMGEGEQAILTLEDALHYFSQGERNRFLIEAYRLLALITLKYGEIKQASSLYHNYLTSVK